MSIPRLQPTAAGCDHLVPPRLKRNVSQTASLQSHNMRIDRSWVTRLGILLAGVLSVGTVGGCRRHSPPDPAHDVDIIAPDGIVLKASYFSPGKAGPGMLLLHQCNMDRHAWDTLTPDLVNAGFHVLTVDQRGFGDTPGTSGPADAQKAPGDADAAYGYLLSKENVDKGRIGVGGASCGVTYSAGLASRHPEIKALLLLSGWADDNSRAYITATRSLAVFGAAADQSGSDAADIREAVAASQHPHSTSRVVRGTAHGVAMFDTDADLEPSIVKWLVARLSADTPGAGR
jgi:dienelactone hydrolase